MLDEDNNVEDVTDADDADAGDADAYAEDDDDCVRGNGPEARLLGSLVLLLVSQFSWPTFNVP